MLRGYKIFWCFVVLWLIFWGSVANAGPRFVFFFIGDGMGEADMHLLEKYHTFRGTSSSLSALSFVGTVGTLSLGEIPDSASSGTALACGVKTRNGMVGVDSSGKRAPSLAEIAKKKGFQVGIITNVALNDATPASFYAHRASRRDYAGIALDMVESGFDLFVGWGIASSREALSLAARRGYTIVWNWSDFLSTRSLPLVALLSFPFGIDRKEGYALKDAVRRGIELLVNEEGFFLAVEGGKIDWCKHMNDVGSLLFELLDFDDAIGEALAFARKHPQETLILVTADHETGGLGTEKVLDFPRILRQPFSYQVFLERLASGDSLPELAKVMWPFEEKTLHQFLKPFDDPNKTFVTFARAFAQEVGISWTTTGHTGQAVPVFLWYQGDLPRDWNENTDIFQFLSRFLEDRESPFSRFH